MGCAKLKSVFEHAQNAQIQIHPTHVQSLMRAFALHRYILECPMILLADCEGPDQAVWMHRLIWALAVAYAQRHVFTWCGQYNHGVNGGVSMLVSKLTV